MESYRVFTASLEGVKDYAVTTKQKITDDIVIETITIGESGRGRKLTYVPVHTLVRSDDPTQLKFLRLGTTKKGALKFFEAERATTDDFCIVVLRSGIGFRGSNVHTGDYYYVEGEEKPKFYEFPGEILATGKIAQGAAGGMSSGLQHIVKMPREKVFRVARSGRLYGNPSSYYHYFDGTQLYRLSLNERTAADIF